MLTEHFRQVKSPRNGLLPQVGFKRKLDTRAALGHGRELEEVPGHDELPKFSIHRGGKKERANLNATERLYAFPQHASDSRELIE
jgi:hypothetical protein